MAPDEPSPLEHVNTWLDKLRSRGLDLPEQLNLLESVLFKDTELSIAEAGHVFVTLRVAPHLVNWYGGLHGGATATLIEVLGMVAVNSMSGTQKPTSTDVNISYISGIPLGTEVEAEAKVLRIGKSLAVASVDIRNKETRKLYAQGRVTGHLLQEEVPLGTAKL